MKAKSYAKINLFLKIEGYKDGYHQLNSRFMKVKNLYDEIEFKEGTFNIIGDFDCAVRDNTIFKAYLGDVYKRLDIREYFLD